MLAEVALQGQTGLTSNERLAAEGSLGETEPGTVEAKGETQVEGRRIAAMLGRELAGGQCALMVGSAEGESGHVVGDKVETFIVYQVGIVFGFVVGRFQTGGDCQCGHTLFGERLGVGGTEWGGLETFGGNLDGDAKALGIGKLVAVQQGASPFQG